MYYYEPSGPAKLSGTRPGITMVYYLVMGTGWNFLMDDRVEVFGITNDQ